VVVVETGGTESKTCTRLIAGKLVEEEKYDVFSKVASAQIIYFPKWD